MSIPVNILMLDTSQPNKDYLRIFASSSFATPIIVQIQYPDVGWFKHLNRISQPEIMQLFNHYRIWLNVLSSGIGQIILENGTHPNQPDSVMRNLFKFPSEVNDFDIALYGKYSDLCSEYEPVDRKYNFTLYRSTGAYGGYAYYLTPGGAQKLINQMISQPDTLSKMINRTCTTGKVITYNPSIVLSDFYRYECRLPESPIPGSSQWWISLIWYAILIIIIGLLIGVTYWYLAKHMTFQPGKEIPIVHSLPDNYASLDPISLDNSIYYGSSKTPSRTVFSSFGTS